MAREDDPTIEFGWQIDNWIAGIKGLYTSRENLLGVNFRDFDTKELEKAHKAYNKWLLEFAAGDQSPRMNPKEP